MQVHHPTFCLHRDIFRIALVFLNFMPATDHSDTERLLTAGI